MNSQWHSVSGGKETGEYRIKLMIKVHRLPIPNRLLYSGYKLCKRKGSCLQFTTSYIWRSWQQAGSTCKCAVQPFEFRTSNNLKHNVFKDIILLSSNFHYRKGYVVNDRTSDDNLWRLSPSYAGLRTTERHIAIHKKHTFQMIYRCSYYGDHYTAQGQKLATTVRHETFIISRSDGIV